MDKKRIDSSENSTKKGNEPKEESQTTIDSVENDKAEDIRETIDMAKEAAIPESQKTDSVKDKSNKTIDKMTEEEISSIKEAVDKIRGLDFQLPQNVEFLENIRQYNMSCEKVSGMTTNYETLKEDELKANEKFEDLRRNFARIVDESEWGEKMFYAIPVIDEMESDNKWDQQWCEVLEKAMKESSPRLCIANLFHTVFTLPKELYFYRIKKDILNQLNEKVVEVSCLLSTRMYQMFKSLKEMSESLRDTLTSLLLLGSQLADLSLESHKIEMSETECEMQEAIKFLQPLIDKKEGISEEEKSKLSEIQNKIKEYEDSIPNELRVSNREQFIAKAKEHYKNTQDCETKLKSIKEKVYCKSLRDLFTLYDNIIKTNGDYKTLYEDIEDRDVEDKTHCNNIITMLKQLTREVNNYLDRSLGLRPFDIQIGNDVNDIIDRLEIISAEDAPEENLKECICSIISTGFGKYDANNNLVFVAKKTAVHAYTNRLKEH